MKKLSAVGISILLAVISVIPMVSTKSQSDLSIEITNPEHGEDVSGIVEISATASGQSELGEVSLSIGREHGGSVLILRDCIEGVGMPSCEQGKKCKEIYTKICTYKWDTSSYVGEEVNLTVSISDVEGNKASDSVGVIVTEELTCNQKCKSLGYDYGTCRSWAITPSVEWGCKDDEVDIGETSDCYVPRGIVGIDKTCCCKKKEAELISFKSFEPSKPVYELGEKVIINGEIEVDASIDPEDLILSVFVNPVGITKITSETVKGTEFDCAMNTMTGDSVCKFSADFYGLEEGRYKVRGKVSVANSNIKPIEAVTWFTIKEETGYATLSVKAYDANTRENIPEATTVILKYIDVPVGIAEEKPVVEETGAEEVEGVKEIVSRTPRTIVVGTIIADGRDTISLKPGIYNLMTYAKDYAIYTHNMVRIQGGNEYNLYAPLSKGWIEVRPLPAKTIPVKEGKLIKIEPSVEEIEVEVLPTEVIKKVSIRPVEVGKSGNFVVEAGGTEATTDTDVEIEEEKLYIKTNVTRVQVKVLPATASEKAREAVGSHKIKDIELKIENKKPIYVVKGESKGRLIGLIPVVIPTETSVNAETGEIFSVSRPWWSFITTQG